MKKGMTLAIIILTLIVILEGTVIYEQSRSHDDINLKECEKLSFPSEEEILGVTKEEFSLISTVVNSQSYNTYIGIFNFMNLKERYNMLSNETINDDGFRIDHLLNATSLSEKITNEQDEQCDDEMNGCLKISYDNFNDFVNSISGVALTKEDLKKYLIGDYLYTEKSSDSVNEVFTVETIKKDGDRYKVSLNGQYNQNEIVIKATLFDLKDLNVIIESVS